MFIHSKTKGLQSGIQGKGQNQEQAVQRVQSKTQKIKAKVHDHWENIWKTKREVKFLK